jgi:hypothetical protein
MRRKVTLLVEQPRIGGLQPQEPTENVSVDKEDVVCYPSNTNEIKELCVGFRELQGVEQLERKLTIWSISPSKMGENDGTKRDTVTTPPLVR